MEKRGTEATPRIDLGEALMEYDAQQSGFIATIVLPIFKTMLKKATFPKITRESMTQDVDAKRAAKAGYKRVNFFSKEGNYNCEEYGLEGPLDDSERKLFASQFDAEMVTTKGVNNLLLIQQEKRAASLLFNTSTFTGASLYTDYSSYPWDAAASDVIGQIKTVRGIIRQNTGIEANALIMGRANLDRLTGNTGIKAAIQYVKELSEAELRGALARILGLDYIIIGNAIRNSSKKLDTFTAADIWSDDYAMVARIVTDANDFTQPGIGRSFQWIADCPENITVEQYREEELRSDIFRVRQHVDEVICDAYFGHLMKVDA